MMMIIPTIYRRTEENEGKITFQAKTGQPELEG
jgi:hypothetical protein